MASKRSRSFHDHPPSPEEEDDDEQTHDSEEEDDEDEQNNVVAEEDEQNDDVEQEEEEQDDDSEGDEVENDDDVAEEQENNAGEAENDDADDDAEEEDNVDDAGEEEEDEPMKKAEEDSGSGSETDSDKYTIKPIPRSNIINSNGNGWKWSKEDEVSVLQSLIDFKNQHKQDPFSNPTHFYEFVRDKLSSSGLKISQVKEKIKRLKSKYFKNLGNNTIGDHPLSFQLSHRIWGEPTNDDKTKKKKKNDDDDVGSGRQTVLALPAVDAPPADTATVSASARKRKRDSMELGKEVEVKRAKTAEKKPEQDMLVGKEVEKVKRAKTVERNAEQDVTEVGKGVEAEEKGEEGYRYLMGAFEGCNELPKVSLFGCLKSYLGGVDASVLEKWDKECKELYLAELQVYQKRVALVKRVSRTLFDVMNSS